MVGILTLAGFSGAIRMSLRQGVLGEHGWGLGAWRRVLSDPGFGDTVMFTLWVVAAATTIAVVAAIALAMLLRRGGWARRALALPVAAPHLVVATVAVAWLAPGGLGDRLGLAASARMIGDRAGWGVIAVYAAKEIPFLTLLALAALDPATDELDDTAALLGAGRWARLRDVILPRLAMPVTAGGLVVAAFVIGAVEVPLLVGPTRPQMLGPYALDVVRIDGPVARADAAVAELVAAAIVGAVGLAVAALWCQRGRSHRRHQARGE